MSGGGGVERGRVDSGSGGMKTYQLLVAFKSRLPKERVRLALRRLAAVEELSMAAALSLAIKEACEKRNLKGPGE